MPFDLHNYVSQLPKKQLQHRISAREYEHRIERIRNFMKSNDIDVCIAWASEAYPGDVGWLTGYDVHIETTVTLIGENHIFQVGGPSFLHYAKEMAPQIEYRLCFDFSIQEEYAHLTFFSMHDLLHEVCNGRLSKIGLLTGTDSLPTNLNRILTNEKATLIDCSSFLREQRYYKSEGELHSMRIAGKIASWAMEAAIQTVRPGVRETDVAAAAEFVMKSCGADRYSFHSVVMSGNRVQNVGGRASNKIIEEGDFVVISPGARIDGLNSTLGRTVIAGGKPTSEQLEFLEICTHAYELAIPQLRSGQVAKHVDLASRNYLQQHGLVPFYSNVHNIGWTECMEGYGGANSTSDFLFPAGVSLMVDVGVFWQGFKNLNPVSTGFRLEDAFILDHNGNTERITDFPIRAWELIKN
jgi:Xaa-Pro aminopeptidase